MSASYRIYLKETKLLLSSRLDFFQVRKHVYPSQKIIFPCISRFIFTFDFAVHTKKLHRHNAALPDHAGSFKAPENHFKSSLERRWVIPLFALVVSNNACGSTFALWRISITLPVTQNFGLRFLVVSSHRDRYVYINHDWISTDESPLNAYRWGKKK